MQKVFVILVAGALWVGWASPVWAQAAFVVTNTTRAGFTASADHNVAGVLTSYQMRVFPRTAVTCTGTPVVCTEPATGGTTYDIGKPTPDASNVVLSPTLKSLTPAIPTNVDQILFVHAVGPGGTSGPSGASPPFVVPPTAPRAVPSAVSFTP